MITLNNKTREKSNKRFKNKIIFFEKYITLNEYYSSLNYKSDCSKIKKNLILKPHQVNILIIDRAFLLYGIHKIL